MAQAAKGGFAVGTVTGIALTALVLAMTVPGLGFADRAQALVWMEQNLGASAWLFGAVLLFFLFDLTRLKNRLATPETTTLRDVVGLDQRLDVWGQLFIGIGVVWTAIGMRSALQAALGGGGPADQSASSVLKNLVDGGILLALTTTIVGGVGGYLMRLAKTVSVGPALQAFYEALDQAGVQALLKATERIESHLMAIQPAEAAPPLLSERSES